MQPSEASSPPMFFFPRANPVRIDVPRIRETLQLYDGSLVDTIPRVKGSK